MTGIKNKEMKVSIHKLSGGFTGMTNYVMSFHIQISRQESDTEELLKEAKANAQEFLDKHFPEEKIDVETIWITEHDYL
jgi:hypothetical protein